LRDQALSQELQDAWWREGGFTEEQGAKVAEMRRRIEEEGLLTPWWDNRPCMQRFLAAKQWDVDKAVAMFRAHLAWRKEWHLDEESFVDTPHGRIPRLLAEFVLPEFPTIKDAYNYVHHGNDKSGRLIYVDRMGGVKLPQLRAACSEERLIMTYVWECEATACFRMPASTLAAGKLVDKTLSIVDLKGFSIPMFDARMRKYLSIVIKLSQDNYPEMLGKMYVINVCRAALGSYTPILCTLRARRSFDPYCVPCVRVATAVPRITQLPPPMCHYKAMGETDSTIPAANRPPRCACR